MTRQPFMCLVIVCCSTLLGPSVCMADPAEDEAAIRKSDAAYIEAYNKHDAKALAALWSPEAVYVDPDTGDEAVGAKRSRKSLPTPLLILRMPNLKLR